MATSVIGVENVGDGLTVDVTLDSAASGAITAFASRLPGDPGAASCSVATISPTEFRITVRATAIHRRLGYYIRVLDGATELSSYQFDRTTRAAGETFEWVCKDSNRDFLDLNERTLVGILADNIQALTRGMEIYLEKTTLPSGARVAVHKIHAGIPAHEDGEKYPQIAIRSYSLKDDPYFANPRSDFIPIQTTISCYSTHQSKVNLEPLNRALGMAVFDVLNGDTSYIEIPLYDDDTSPVRLYECYALDVTSDEYVDQNASVYVARADLNWQSKLFVGREKA